MSAQQAFRAYVARGRLAICEWRSGSAPGARAAAWAVADNDAAGGQLLHYAETEWDAEIRP